MPDTTVERLAPGGMLTVKAKPGDPALAAALAAIGLAVPGQRAILRAGDRAVAWMAPDEVLLLCPAAETAALAAALAGPLAATHHLIADVSDARATFRIAGPRAREVLAKLCPVDLHPDAFRPGTIRRTRAAQVAAAIWAEDAGDFRLVCFRSVAPYVHDLLTLSADPAAAVGLWP